MTFPPIPQQTPTTVRRLIVTLIQRDDLLANGGTQAAEYHVTIEDQYGNAMHFNNDSGNLVPHLTAQELTGAQNWLNGIMQKAINAFIP